MENLRTELKALRDTADQQVAEQDQQALTEINVLAASRQEPLYKQLCEILPDLPSDVVSTALAGQGISSVQVQAATDLLTQATLPKPLLVVMIVFGLQLL